MDALFVDDGNLDQCKDANSAENTLNEIEKLFGDAEFLLNACPLPCQQTYYEMKIEKFNQVRISSQPCCINSLTGHKQKACLSIPAISCTETD